MERTVTFTMEDALISPITMAILTGAGVVEATESEPIVSHVTEIVAAEKLSNEDARIVLKLSKAPSTKAKSVIYVGKLDDNGSLEEAMRPVNYTIVDSGENRGTVGTAQVGQIIYPVTDNGAEAFESGTNYLVDYYTEHKSKATQINIEVDKFGGNYYLEGSTLWRDKDGRDKAAEYIIPNCKVQSNFTFSMAASGDPGTFTFTMDAFPAMPKFGSKKKVLAAIQVIDEDTHAVADGVMTPGGTQTKGE